MNTATQLSESRFSADHREMTEQTEAQNQESLANARRLSVLGLSGMELEAPGYELVREIGRGTYGVVWFAKEKRTGIEVAIKFFHKGSGEQWQRLQEEVRQLAQLHIAPNIVRLLDVDVDRDIPYFVMDYAEGGSLRDYLQTHEAMPVDRAIEVFREVAEAISYVHAKGILHCDLKPANILLDKIGRPLVADFGQAHLVGDTESSLGTFFYMAPEQADFGTLPDIRWDVYALGAILYAMLTGRPPRDDHTLRKELENTEKLNHRLDVYRRHLETTPHPKNHRHTKGVDRELAGIVDRCLEIDPEKRFRDVESVATALKRWDRRRRRRSLMWFGWLVPAVLIAVLITSSWLTTQSSIEASQQYLLSEYETNQKSATERIKNRLHSNFEKRILVLEDLVRFPDVGRALDEQDRWKAGVLLKDFFDKNSGLGFYRCSLVTAGGEMLANYPPLPSGIKKWCWRDWFNGEMDRPDEQDKDFPPIQTTHFSEPYIGGNGYNSISISLPVRMTPEGPVVGVMAVSMDIKQTFADWIDLPSSRQSKDFKVVVLNDRLHCIYHVVSHVNDGAEVTELEMPKKGVSATVWKCDEFLAAQQAAFETDDLYKASRQQERLRGYVDPIDKQRYWATFSPMTLGGKQWVVAVQQPLESVQAQLDDFQKLEDSAFSRFRWVMMVGLLAVPTVWAVLMWIVRREEQVVND